MLTQTGKRSTLQWT